MPKQHQGGVHVSFQDGSHSAWHHRWMSEMRAGGYDIDKREPESMDLPEVCAFNEDGLLNRGRCITPCKGEVLVQVDSRFGVIPVCKNHLKFVQKEQHATQKRKRTSTHRNTNRDTDGDLYAGA